MLPNEFNKMVWTAEEQRASLMQEAAVARLLRTYAPENGLFTKLVRTVGHWFSGHRMVMPLPPYKPQCQPLAE